MNKKRTTTTPASEVAEAHWEAPSYSVMAVVAPSMAEASEADSAEEALAEVRSAEAVLEEGFREVKNEE